MKRYETYKDSGIEWLGEIPEHWKVCRTKNIVSLINERAIDPALKKVALVSFATAFANKVFPVPGSPYKITPLGGFMPISSYNSG